jgi:hypothetical protein
MATKTHGGLRRYPHPGKFEGELQITEYLYEALEGAADEEVGSVEEMGWYGWIHLKTRDERKDFLKSLEVVASAQGDKLTSDERNMILDTSAIIVSESDQGFYGAKYYTLLSEAKRDWKEIVDAYEKFYEESEGEEG